MGTSSSRIFGAAKLQSAPVADNPRYAAVCSKPRPSPNFKVQDQDKDSTNNVQLNWYKSRWHSV